MNQNGVRSERKQFGKCGEELTCFKCGKTSHCVNEFTSNKKVCYKCNEEGHITREFPKNKEATKPNMPPRPKARAF